MTKLRALRNILRVFAFGWPLLLIACHCPVANPDAGLPPVKTRAAFYVSPNPTPAHGALRALDIQFVNLGDQRRILLPADKIFYPSSSEIQPSAYPGLNALASALQSYGQLPIKIIGYTDGVASASESKKLAAAQAQSILAFLWSRGLCQRCLTAVGVGSDEDATLASNRSIIGSAINRRVELRFRAPANTTLLGQWL